MAKKSASPVRMKPTGMNAKWIQNAMKSIGISTKEAFKEIYPNISEVASESTQASKDVLNTLRRSTKSSEDVLNTMRNNKYVKYASQAYRNALSDLRSGKLNNTDRFMGDDESFEDMFESIDSGNSSGGVSFGEEDTPSTNNVNFNYVNKGNNDAVLAFQEQAQRQSEAIIKTNKASMDAQIAVSSASLYQVEKLGNEIISHLGNINNNLTALVNYNNENITKFIEASISYYEKMGKAQEEPTKSAKLTAADVFNNQNGGINIAQYKNFVKQQLKDNLRNSPLGMVELLSDDSILEMAVSNPLGFATKGIVSYMIPKLVGTTIDSVEKTFSAFVPTMLNRLADWGDEYTVGILGTLKRNIGKTFGLRVKQKNRLEARRVEKGPIPFDGETKHAITEIITKELREQTSYLERIASHLGVNTKNARENADVWDYEKGQYVKVKDIQHNIASIIQDSFLNTFKNGEFGKSMQNLVYAQKNEKAQKSLEHTLNQFLTLAGRSGRSINFQDKSKDSEYQKILNKLRKNTKERGNVNVIERYISDLVKNNPNAANDFARSLLSAQTQRNSTIEDINQNPTEYNLFASGLNGANIDKIIEREFGYFKYSKNWSRGKDAKVEPVSNKESTGLIGQMFSSFTGHMMSQMNKAMTGDFRGANSEMGAMIKDQGKLLFDRFTGTILRPFRDAFVGTGKENEETVLGNLKSLGKDIREGIMTKFFGEKNEDGKRTRIASITSKLGDIFTKGMIGWEEAFFGKEMTEEDKKEYSSRLMKTFKDRLPATMTGTIIGGGAGAAFGGILGNLIGGPFAGAILGSVGGFLSKSERFQEFLFGKKDEEGNRMGGLISKKVQDFVKENKIRLLGGASVGGIGGALGITGNGLLGTLIGGPFAGAIMGMTSSMLFKSNMFTDFLFGSSKDGQKGLFKGITDAFREHAKISKSDDATIDGKKTGMSAIGIGAGALSGALLTKFGLMGAMLGPIGPIGGALAGLGLSIKASGGNFREWLFGKDEEDIHGKKVHRQGIVGQFGNMLNTSVFRPMLHEGQYLFKDLASSIKHEALTPFAFLSEAVAGIAGDVYGSFRNIITKGFNSMGDIIQKNVITKLGDVLNPFVDTINKSAEIAAFAAKNAALLPFRLIRKGMEFANSKLKFITDPILWAVDEVKNLAVSGVSRIVNYAIGGFKTVFGLMTAPLRFVGGLAQTGVNKLYNYVQTKKAEKQEENTPIDWGTKEGTFAERLERARENRKREKEQLKEERRQWKIHDKNARLIAKYTNNQYGADTEEGRLALRRAKPSAYRKLNLSIDTEDEEKRKATIAKEGRSTNGMNSDQLSKADVDALNEQGKQTYYLHELYKTVVRGEKPKDVVDKQKKEDKKKQKEEDKIKEKEDKLKENEEASMNEEFSPQNGSFREYFKSVGLDLKDYFFGSDQVDPVTGKITGHSDDILTRGKNSIVNELLSYKNSGKRVKQRFMNMARGLRDFHKGRKNNQYIKKNGQLPPEEENKNQDAVINVNTESGGEGKGRRKTGGGFGMLAFQLPKTVSALPVVIQGFAQKAKEDFIETTEKSQKEKNEDAKVFDRLEQAKENGTSSEELKAKIEKEDEKNRQIDMQKNIKTTAEATVKHGFNWSSIFGKKGLITGGLLLLSPLLLKLFKWLVTGPGKALGSLLLSGLGSIASFFSGGVSSIADVIKDALGGASDAAERTEKNKDRSNGKSQEEAIEDETSTWKKSAKEASEGNYLGAWNTFVTDKDGKVNHSTFAKNKFLATQMYSNKVVRKGVKSAGKVAKSGVKLAAKGLEGYKNKQKLASQVGNYGAKKLKEQYGSYAEAVANYGDGGYLTVGEKVKNKAATLSDDASKAVKKSVTKIKSSDNKIISTVISYVDKFFTFITKKVANNLEKKIAESTFTKIIKSVKSVIQSQSSKIAQRASKIIAGNTALAAASAGILWATKEGAFVTLGAINGATGAARLFQVDAKYVDATMIAISSIFGGLSGTTLGSIIDMVNEIVAEVTGADFLSETASAIYLKIAGEKKSTKLESGQQEFYDKYTDYKTEQIEKAYTKALKDGSIDKTTTLDQYKEAVANGTIDVEYKSFVDYNDSKHKSIGARITDAATSVASGVRKGFNKVTSIFKNSKKSEKPNGYLDTSKIKNKVTSAQLKEVENTNLGPVSRREQVTFKKSSNSNYLDTSKIKNKVTSAQLKEVGNSNLGPVKRKNTVDIGKIIKANTDTTLVYVDDSDGSYYKGDGTHFTASGTQIGKISTSELMQMIVSNQLHQSTLTTDPKSIESTYNATLGGFLRDKQDQIEKLKKTWAKGSKVKTKALTLLSDGIGKINDFIKEKLPGNGFIGSLGKSIIGKKSTTVYMDTSGNYYKPNGNNFDYCNGNGDVIRTGITANEVEKQMELGLITGTKEIKNSAAQDAVSKIQSAIKSAWDTAKDIVSNAWDTFTKNIKQTNYVDIPGASSSSSTSSTNATVAGGNGKGVVHGGGRGGDDTVNGFSYYAQNDPRWKNTPYNMGNDNATMNDSGCGPTAFSMVASQMTGRDVAPTETAQLAKLTGNRDDTGTNWNFINQAANTYGLQSQEAQNPSSQYISDQLDQGHPMILSGASGGGFGVKHNSAYTPAGHYVVAVGKDNDGNVIINDPRGKQYSGKYNLDDVASETGAAWSFDGGGYGNKNLKNRKQPLLLRRRGGFGKKDKTSSTSTQNKMNWMSCVMSVKAAIAEKAPSYSQSSYTNISVNGKSFKVRNDCSGYVSGALICYGAFPTGYLTSSSGFGSSSDVSNKLTKAGFVKHSFTGWNDLKQGDIIVAPGSHVEIFSHNKGRTHYVYNNGSTSSIRSATPTKTGGNHNYTVVWTPPENANGTANGTSVVEGVGSDYPKYTDLTESEKNKLATLITGETGGEDEVASRQEASQIVNLNEHKGNSKNAKGLMKTINSGWYASSSFSRGKTKTAQQAVEDVIIKGHRTFPRYVVEHDWFPNDILNAKDREDYKFGDNVSNKYGSKYQFYTFMGKDKKGDIAGYFKDLYEKYKDDIPWGENAVGTDATTTNVTTDTVSTETTEQKGLFDAISDYVSATADAAIKGILTGNYDTTEMQNAWNGASLGTTTTTTTGDTSTSTSSNDTIASTGVSTNNIPKKEKETGNAKYPKTIMVNGTTYKIPQQTEFGSFSQKHGCSLAAGTMGIQKAGNIVKSPDEIYNWANKNLPNKGIKLGIYGTMQAINAMSGNKNAAKWYPITSKNKKKAIQNIDTAIDNGDFVLFEQEDPIHTTTFIGRKKNGTLAEVTNGDYKDKWNHSTSWEVNQKAIKGNGDESKQTSWWHGRDSSAGYVVVSGNNTSATSINNNTNVETKKNNKKNGGKGGGFGYGRSKFLPQHKNMLHQSIQKFGGYGNNNSKDEKIINNYINNNSSSDKNLQMILQLLQQIANNTLTTSQKLELLKELGNGDVNIYQSSNNGGGNGSSKVNSKSSKKPIKTVKEKGRSSNQNGTKRNETLAYKIAQGI